MSEHPLHILERLAREYDAACRASARADNAADNAATAAENTTTRNNRSLRAAELRARVITASARLQDAAEAFASWKSTR